LTRSLPVTLPAALPVYFAGSPGDSVP